MLRKHIRGWPAKALGLALCALLGGALPVAAGAAGGNGNGAQGTNPQGRPDGQPIYAGPGDGPAQPDRGNGNNDCHGANSCPPPVTEPPPVTPPPDPTPTTDTQPPAQPPTDTGATAGTQTPDATPVTPFTPALTPPFDPGTQPAPDTPATGPTAPPAGATPLPTPQLARDANLYPVAGTVLVRLPGSNTYIPLNDARQVPMGTTVDATQGTVELCDAHDARNTLQCANFYEGTFKIAQKRSRTPITDITLVGGSFRSCNATARAAAVGTRGRAARHVSHRSVRHLWGNGHGRFRTNGRASAAAVRGTFWLTDDRCDGTLTGVRRGIVAVTDFHAHRTVLVPAGHRYFAALH